MPDPVHRRARACARCGVTASIDELRGQVGWTPLRAGWRCPDCTRARAARVDKLAQALVDGHAHHRWVGTDEHPDFDECLWCEVLRRATQLVLRPP